MLASQRCPQGAPSCKTVCRSSLRVRRNQTNPCSRKSPRTVLAGGRRGTFLSRHNLMAAHLLLGTWCAPGGICWQPVGAGTPPTSGLAQPSPCSSRGPGAASTQTLHQITLPERPCTLQIPKNRQLTTSQKKRAKDTNRRFPDLAWPLTCCVNLGR